MKTLAQYLQEARKNPELNPKVSVNQEIIDHVDSAKKLSGTAIKNSFVSFTQIDKLGINPASKYDTPIGIYSYPAEYVKEQTGEYKPMSTLPFAGRSPYANIFSVRGNIVDLNNLSNSDLQKYYEKLSNFYSEFKGFKKGTDGWKDMIDFVEMIINKAGSNAKFKTNGGQFWYVTMKLAKILSSDSDWRASNPAVSWNKLFREIGIDGCVDMGEGIIHTSEPTQAVFFSKRVVAKNKRVDNKYSPQNVEKAKEFGKEAKAKAVTLDTIAKGLIKLKDWEELYSFIVGNSGYYNDFIKKYINKIPEEQAIDLMKLYPFVFFKIIKNPSINMMKGVIDKDVSYISILQQYGIKVPPEVEIYAFEKNPALTVEYNEKPSEEFQLHVIDKTPEGILKQFVKYFYKWGDPSKKVEDKLKSVGYDDKTLYVHKHILKGKI